MNRENKVEIKLTANDLQAVLYFLGRVNLNGQEATGYVTLTHKIQAVINLETPKEEEANDKKEDK